MSRAQAYPGSLETGANVYCIVIVLDGETSRELAVLATQVSFSAITFEVTDALATSVSLLQGIPTKYKTESFALSQPVSIDDPARKDTCLSYRGQARFSQRMTDGDCPILDYLPFQVLTQWHMNGFISVVMIIERIEPKSSLEIFRTQQKEKSSELAGQGNPSAASKDFAKMNTAYCNTEQEQGAFIFRGWPLENKRTSPVIFNKLFASLKDSLDNISINNSGIAPTPELLEISAMYISAVTKLQPKEKPRHDDIKAILTRVFETNPTTAKPAAENSPIPDIVWTTNFLGKQTPIILCEVKNYLGIQGDAIFQVAASYSKIISKNQEGSPPAALNFNYPVILMGCMGTLLQIYAAIHLDGVFLEKIFVRDVDSILDTFLVAQVFSVLRMAGYELNSFYSEGIPQGTDVNSEAAFLTHRYPSPCSAFGYQGMFPLLEFWSRVRKSGKPDKRSMGSPDPNIRHNIFFATLRGWRNTATEVITNVKSIEVAVKFTYTYNAEVHRKLSEDPMKLAPRLFFCGRIRGGLFMVVMERYIAKTLQDERSEASANRGNPQKLATIQHASDAVQKALRILSENSFVHGNGSTSKVLVGFPASAYPVLGGPPVFTIIGFDFAGEAGKDRYAVHLPSRTFTVANIEEPTIERGARMEIDHDRMGFAGCFAPL